MALLGWQGAGGFGAAANVYGSPPSSEIKSNEILK